MFGRHCSLALECLAELKLRHIINYTVRQVMMTWSPLALLFTRVLETTVNLPYLDGSGESHNQIQNLKKTRNCHLLHPTRTQFKLDGDAETECTLLSLSADSFEISTGRLEVRLVYTRWISRPRFTKRCGFCIDMLNL